MPCEKYRKILWVKTCGDMSGAISLCKQTANKMEIQYRGYLIETTEKSHCAVIMKGDDIVKCIAGNINADGTTDKIEKAKAWIDQNG